MATVSVKEKTNLKLELDGGIVDEKQKIIMKSFSKVKTDALDEEVYDTALALQGLQQKDLLGVKKTEEIRLIRE